MEENNACAPTTVSPRVEDCYHARAGLWEERSGGSAHLPSESETAGDLARGVARRGEQRAFPGQGAQTQGKLDEQRIPELERKIGQQAIEIDFLKKVLRRFREQVPPVVGNGTTGSTSKSAKQPKRRSQ